ncbi:MAG TPA: NAD(P)H-dependent oxidoreductase [Chitinophagaceae bacterium]|jgi:glutathione-regulated potassium-efflux system ancillary protein KefG|nr:NAD(P)H-dependent oxidoreductase [Chitinophagaceae bacterium]
MVNILVLLAHPLLEKSRVHVELYKAATSVKGVFINDLYERYPDFDIDIEREKRLLLNHQIIIWQHPFYWYSAPPILKQWQDLVLEHGWAYGKKGTALSGKKVFNVISSGGSQEAYTQGGFNKYAIHEFMRPFERTAELCRMNYWPPFWVHGVHRLEAPDIQAYCQQYKNMLTALVNDIFAEEEISSHTLMNDLFPITTTNS